MLFRSRLVKFLLAGLILMNLAGCERSGNHSLRQQISALAKTLLPQHDTHRSGWLMVAVNPNDCSHCLAGTALQYEQIRFQFAIPDARCFLLLPSMRTVERKAFFDSHCPVPIPESRAFENDSLLQLALQHLERETFSTFFLVLNQDKELIECQLFKETYDNRSSAGF